MGTGLNRVKGILQGCQNLKLVHRNFMVGHGPKANTLMPYCIFKIQNGTGIP